MNDYLVVHPCNIFAQDKVVAPFDVVDMYDFAKVDFSAYKCMILFGFVDQDFLLEEKHIIEEFLADGKIVCFFGNLVTPWLPGQEMFVPKEINFHGDYNVTIAKEHPIFDGVLEDDLTITKGVKGFFARGHHPAPANAEVLLTLNNGETITYIDRESTNGTIFVHVGFNFFDISGSGNNMGQKNTKNLLPARMLEWAEDEAKRLQGGEQ